MILLRILWLWNIYVFCGLAVRTSKKRRLAELSDEEPLDVSTSRNSAGSSSRLERLSSDDESIPEPPEPPARDLFTRDLKHKWAKGKLSSADVQSLASSAKSQGARNLNRLAAAGTNGEISILYRFFMFCFVRKTRFIKFVL